MATKTVSSSKRARLGDSGIKYPETAWDVIRDLTWKDWGLIVGVSVLLGLLFYFLPEFVT